MCVAYIAVSVDAARDCIEVEPVLDKSTHLYGRHTEGIEAREYCGHITGIRVVRSRHSVGPQADVLRKPPSTIVDVK